MHRVEADVQHPGGWLGEAEGLQVGLDAAGIKLVQMERQLDRRSDLIQLGLPGPRRRS